MSDAALSLRSTRLNRNDPLSALAIRLLVAGGHVTQEAADAAFSAACNCVEAEARRMHVELPWVNRDHREQPVLKGATIPPGMRAPQIDWIGSTWRCEWKFESGAGMGMMGLGATPDEAFQNWFEANTPAWAAGTSPWRTPKDDELRAAGIKVK